jgi:hypothetical protein
MKKYILIIIGLFLLTGWNKEYQMTCSGKLTEDNNENTLNVTIDYDFEDKVKSLDYEMVYPNEEVYQEACNSVQDKKPTCNDLKVSYSENDEVTRSFKKNDIINMLSVIGASECK